MLVELSIENLGVIESARIVFGGGFTALTGETGAGKTMLVEAISLVVGKRADASVVRDGATEARVEARFLSSGDGTETETILCRVVGAEGRSRAYVDGRMATVGALSELGAVLVDIHGQHAHQRLLSSAHQRDALDRYAGVDLQPVLTARERIKEIDVLLSALGGDDRSRSREIDLLRFQVEEIEEARISSTDEDEELSVEEELLASANNLREALGETLVLLSEDSSAADLIGDAIRKLGASSALANARDELLAVQVGLSGAISSVREMLDRVEENPMRLAEVRARRQLLRDLCRKYGDTLNEVVLFGQETASRLAELEGYGDRVAGLSAEREEALAELREAERAVGALRRARAGDLAEAVGARLPALDLPHAELTVSVGDAASDSAGDSVVFLFAANPGMAPQPLNKVASGGELARIMLALRLVLSEDPGTMVFDEVDAGIGGAAAVAVAVALRELGASHQVLAVTHLPQVAAAAHHQIGVSKSVRDGRTFGNARSLPGEAREAELARMLSGGLADATALAHARDLLTGFASQDAH